MRRPHVIGIAPPVSRVRPSHMPTAQLRMRWLWGTLMPPVIRPMLRKRPRLPVGPLQNVLELQHNVGCDVECATVAAYSHSRPKYPKPARGTGLQPHCTIAGSSPGTPNALQPRTAITLLWYATPKIELATGWAHSM